MGLKKKNKKINLFIKTKIWKDKDTGAWCVYSKKLEVSGYGITKKKAEKMFIFSLKEFIKFSQSLPPLTEKMIEGNLTHFGFVKYAIENMASGKTFKEWCTSMKEEYNLSKELKKYVKKELNK